MKLIRLLGFFVVITFICGCTTTQPNAGRQKPVTRGLRPPTSIKNGNIESFKYIYITPTIELTSGTGYTIGGQYYSSSKSVNPADVISGILIKAGFIRLPELKSELTDETLIVNYGESGRRSTGLGGYTIEVTIQFISSKSSSLICSCTAEGQGTTEADDIRQAVTRCLSELVSQGD